MVCVHMRYTLKYSKFFFFCVVDFDQRSVEPLGTFPEFCSQSERIDTNHEDGSSSTVLVGPTTSGKLYSAHPGSDAPTTLSSNATSFIIAADFVIFTTTAHEAVFVPIPSLTGPNGEIDTSTEKRRVERGSRIVTAVPSAMSLVLQMPRGN